MGLIVAIVVAALLLSGGAVLIAFDWSPEGFDTATQAPSTRKIVVTFEGGNITRSELQEEIDSFAGMNGLEDVTPGSWQYKAVLSQVVPPLLEAEIAEAYAKEQGITVTEKEVNRAIKENGDSELTSQQPREEIYRNLVVEKVKERVVGGVEVSQQEVEQYYEENKDLRYTMLERRCVRRILFANDQQAAAEEVENQLKNGGNFAKLANKYSQDRQSTHTAGDIDCWEHNGALNPSKVEKLVFSAKEGQVLGPIETDSGLIVVEVTKIIPERIVPLKEVDPEITRHLTHNQREKRFATWVQAQARKRHIEYHLPGYQPPRGART